MKKKFLLNLILLVILNLIVKPIWVFGIDRYVQNAVGSSEYGVLFALFNLSVILNIVLDFGITNFNNRHISQQPQSFTVFFPNIVVIKVLLSLLYAVFVFSIAFILGYEKRQFFILSLLVINQVIISFTLYLRSNISGLQYYTTDSILSVSDRIIMIIACILSFFSYFKQHIVSIEWFVIIQTISYVFSLLLVLAILLSKTGLPRFRFRKTISWTIIKAGIPFAILIFLMTTYSRIDSVMLERILTDGKQEAGIYAQSFRIIDSITMMPILFAGLLLPMFSKMLGKKEDISPLTIVSFELIWVIAIAFTLASFFNAQPIIELLYKQHIIYSAKVFSVLILSFIPVSVIYIFSTIITAGGKLTWLNISALLSVVLNFSLNLILIPQYKAFGAAISSLITQCFMAITQLFIVKYQFGAIYPGIFKIVIFTFISIIVAFLISYCSLTWIICFILTGICITALGWAIGLLPIKRLSDIARLLGIYGK